MNKPKLAYTVRCDDGHAVVFATSGAAARRLGAAELGLDFEEVESCCRSTDYDQYAETGLPEPRVLIAQHYWWFDCGSSQCSERVSEDSEERVFDATGTPYCSPECQQREERREAVFAAEEAELRSAALAKWPGTTICWMQQSKQSVFLRFPGGEAGVTWKKGEETVLLQPRDKDAWLAYKATLQTT